MVFFAIFFCLWVIKKASDNFSILGLCYESEYIVDEEALAETMLQQWREGGASDQNPENSQNEPDSDPNPQPIDVASLTPNHSDEEIGNFVNQTELDDFLVNELKDRIPAEPVPQ